MPNTKADLARLAVQVHFQENWGGMAARDELLAIAGRLLAERTDAREHACKAIATAMGARQLLGLLITGIKGLLAEAHVIQERDEEQGIVTLSKVVHAARLAALLEPDETTNEGETE